MHTPKTKTQPHRFVPVRIMQCWWCHQRKTLGAQPQLYKGVHTFSPIVNIVQGVGHSSCTEIFMLFITLTNRHFVDYYLAVRRIDKKPVYINRLNCALCVLLEVPCGEKSRKRDACSTTANRILTLARGWSVFFAAVEAESRRNYISYISAMFGVYIAMHSALLCVRDE